MTFKVGDRYKCFVWLHVTFINCMHSVAGHIMLLISAGHSGSVGNKGSKMSWQQDEPKVIDEEMLHQAIEEQGPQGQAGKIAKEEGIKYTEVLHLQLDYRSKTFT